MGIEVVALLRCLYHRAPDGDDHVNVEPNELSRLIDGTLRLIPHPAILENDILALYPAEVAQPFLKYLISDFAEGIGRRARAQSSYFVDLLRLLRIGNQQSAKSKAPRPSQITFVFMFLVLSLLPVAYLITLSALTSTFGGIVRPICLAAFRLTMNSNFVGCSTGMSAGLAPFKILCT
jgi:hypothetical protein